ncbi:MAG: Amino-acid acetyltransferase [Verrucomicrobiota bacterium]|jgi:amino-acid N-acetyltransferase
MKVSDLRGILQYVPRFREKTFVVAVDGEVAASPNLGNLLLDIAVLRSLSIKVILVHGCGAQLLQLAQERGTPITSSDGTGVTDEATLRLGIEASHAVLQELMQGLASVDLRAAYANVIVAHPAGILGGVDTLCTGKVERVETGTLQTFLQEGIIPVIPPIGFDGEGRTFRVNSDAVALEVAEAMRAVKIIYLAPGGTLREGDQLVRQLSVWDTEEIARKRRANGELSLVSKLEHAAKACRGGIPRVHLLDGTQNEALLSEIFSHEGIGTMVYSNEYQQMRRALKKDVRAVMALIRESIANAELVKRSRAELLALLDDYWLLEIDRNLVGCVAVHLYPEQELAELACLYVAKSHEGKGYGRKLMAFAEQLAAKKGAKHLIALSTQAYNFFQQKGGFLEVSPDALPPERRRKWEASGRNSKVMRKATEPVRPHQPSNPPLN